MIAFFAAWIIVVPRLAFQGGDGPYPGSPVGWRLGAPAAASPSGALFDGGFAGLGHHWPLLVTEASQHERGDVAVGRLPDTEFSPSIAWV